MKKLIIYGNRLIEIKTITDLSFDSPKKIEKGEKYKLKTTKYESNSIASTMKFYKELLYANACEAIDNGSVLFITGLNDEADQIDHAEYERRLKVFLQRTRRQIDDEKHILVKEYGDTVGYHYHMFIWNSNVTEDDITPLWNFGSIKVERIETITDLARLGNYCFNYSTKFNPMSKNKIQRKLNGLRMFDIHESLVKKSSGLVLPDEILVLDDFELGDEYSCISHSERLLSLDQLWTSTFFEKVADKSSWTRYNSDEGTSGKEAPNFE